MWSYQFSPRSNIRRMILSEVLIGIGWLSRVNLTWKKTIHLWETKSHCRPQLWIISNANWMRFVENSALLLECHDHLHPVSISIRNVYHCFSEIEFLNVYFNINGFSNKFEVDAPCDQGNPVCSFYDKCRCWRRSHCLECIFWYKSECPKVVWHRHLAATVEETKDSQKSSNYRHYRPSASDCHSSER